MHKGEQATIPGIGPVAGIARTMNLVLCLPSRAVGSLKVRTRAGIDVFHCDIRVFGGSGG
jgi:hypothetical protein